MELKICLVIARLGETRIGSASVAVPAPIFESQVTTAESAYEILFLFFFFVFGYRWNKNVKSKFSKHLKRSQVSTADAASLGTRNWQLENAEKLNEKETKQKQSNAVPAAECGGGGAWENYIKWNKQK